MDQPAISLEKDFSASYYNPPYVKWWVLAVVFGVSQLAISLLVPSRLSDGLVSLVYQSWGLYLCVWIRRLNPAAKSIYWMLGAMVSDGVALILSLPPRPQPELGYVIASLDLAYFVCFIVVIYVIRDELVRHYNLREDYGLSLGPIMTFFFSFVYFQYHLYDIAEHKQQRSTSLTT